MQNSRYTLYFYTSLHACIDCEDCKDKICNFTPNSISGEILDKIAAHESRRHKDESVVGKR